MADSSGGIRRGKPSGASPHDGGAQKAPHAVPGAAARVTASDTLPDEDSRMADAPAAQGRGDSAGRTQETGPDHALDAEGISTATKRGAPSPAKGAVEADLAVHAAQRRRTAAQRDLFPDASAGLPGESPAAADPASPPRDAGNTDPDAIADGGTSDRGQDPTGRGDIFTGSPQGEGWQVVARRRRQRT